MYLSLRDFDRREGDWRDLLRMVVKLQQKISRRRYFLFLPSLEGERGGKGVHFLPEDGMTWKKSDTWQNITWREMGIGGYPRFRCHGGSFGHGGRKVGHGVYVTGDT